MKVTAGSTLLCEAGAVVVNEAVIIIIAADLLAPYVQGLCGMSS
jgi:predicted anti-sigma-YlaC factor YlaD